MREIFFLTKYRISAQNRIRPWHLARHNQCSFCLMWIRIWELFVLTAWHRHIKIVSETRKHTRFQTISSCSSCIRHKFHC